MRWMNGTVLGWRGRRGGLSVVVFPWGSRFLISSQDVQIDCPHLCITSFNAKTALEMFMSRFIKCRCAVLCHAGPGYGKIFTRSPFRRGIERTRHKISMRGTRTCRSSQRDLWAFTSPRRSISTSSAHPSRPDPVHLMTRLRIPSPFPLL